MRIPRSLSLFFITTLYLIAPVNGICGLILTQGESYSIEFDSLSYCTEFTDERYISGLVTLSPLSLVDTSFILSIYENSINETPIRTGNYGLSPNFGMQGVGYLEFSNSAFWQDFQGVFYIEVLAGTVEIESFTAATIIGTSLYSQTFPVPIPSSCIFLLSGVLLIFSIRFFNTKKMSF